LKRHVVLLVIVMIEKMLEYGESECWMA
jgi:hypothetical protein